MTCVNVLSLLDCLGLLVNLYGYLCYRFQLFGCTIIVIGIWILIDPYSILSQQHTNTAFDQFLDDSSHFGYQTIAAYILIAVGVVVVVIGFLGCCGALRHSECMLITVRYRHGYFCHILPVCLTVCLMYSTSLFTCI